MRDGNRKAKIADFTREAVAVDESTRCEPNKANVARYRELQSLQDQLSRIARPAFAVQRKLAE
jgi:xylulokinase